MGGWKMKCKNCGLFKNQHEWVEEKFYCSGNAGLQFIPSGEKGCGETIWGKRMYDPCYTCGFEDNLCLSCSKEISNG